jgi:death-on-curing family protein
MKFAERSELFGNEKDDSFKGTIGNIYQSFAGQDIYPSIEEKAANLLYIVTKNHSFSDGNKRIAASMFLYFLDRNGLLFNEDGRKLIDDHTLVALTIMIAESRPEEKEMMISVIMNCIV